MVQTGPQIPPPADPGDGAGYTQSPESAALARYYANIEARLIADGLLRADGGVADAPYTAEMLAANFERIALYDEYTLSGGRFIQRETPAQLRRWEAPVQLQAHFGASVDTLQQAEDLSILSTYARRLSRASGHPIITVPEGGNFHVLYLDRDEQRGAGDLLRRLVPGIEPSTYSFLQSEDGGVPASETVNEPRLMRRLSPEVQGEILRLTGQDHHIEIATEHGCETLRLRLSDAIREALPVAGLQVHRSHWVATAHVVSVRRDGDRAVLTLSDGTEIPASRSHLSALRAAGLLAR
jgi:hypothetical protein